MLIDHQNTGLGDCIGLEWYTHDGTTHRNYPSRREKKWKAEALKKQRALQKQQERNYSTQENMDVKDVIRKLG